MNSLKRTKRDADEISIIKNKFPVLENNETTERVDLSWKLVAPQISTKPYTPLVF